MVQFQLVARARGRPTFQDTPSEPLDANRRDHAGTAATHHAVPIGAFETAPDVGTNTLGRCRAAVGRWKIVAWLKAGPAPSHQVRRVGQAGLRSCYTTLIALLRPPARQRFSLGPNTLALIHACGAIHSLRPRNRWPGRSDAAACTCTTCFLQSAHW